MINTAAQAIAAYQQNHNIASVAVCDTAANLQAKLDDLQTLAAAGKLTALTLSDTLYSGALTVNGNQLVSDAAALGRLFGCYGLVIDGSLTAQQAASLNLGHAAGLALLPTVADTAAGVLAKLDALQALAAAGELAAITLTDGTTPTLNLSAAQAAADGDALAKITSPYQLTVSNPGTASLNLAAGSALPPVIAPGTSVVFQGLGLWQMDNPRWTATAFQFAAPYGGVNQLATLDVTNASFGLGCSVFNVGGYAPAELIARGTTEFAGTLNARNSWSVAPLSLAIERSASGPGLFSNQGIIEVSSGYLAVSSTTDGVLRNLGTVHVGLGQLTLGVTLDNSGLVEVQSTSHLVANAAVINESGGQIILSSQYQNGSLRMSGSLSNDGLVAASSGALQVDGPVSGSGIIVVGDGSLVYKGSLVEVSLNAAVAATQHISFASGEGTLKLGQPSSFHGIVSDFSFHDRIDLVGIQADSTRYDAGSGTLTVLSGSSVVSSFALPGGSQLYAYSDDRGGTFLSLEARGNASQVSGNIVACPPGNAPLHNWVTPSAATPVTTRRDWFMNL